MKTATVLRVSVMNLVLALLASAAGAKTEALNFKEVYDLLRTNLAGVNEAELDRAAAQGLIEQLGPRVVLVTNQPPTTTETNARAIVRTAIYDRAYAYIRIGEIKPDADKELLNAYKNLSSSNRLKGVVLDLRFAYGTDYNAAVAMANCFLSAEQPLIDFGEGLKKSTAKPAPINRPLAILVNRKTAVAAEALAGMLRQTDAGLVLGSPTAGLAAIAKEFSLKTGQHLRVAMSSIKVGKDHPLPLTGLKPDISIEVSLEDEANYVEDAYKELSKSSNLAKSTGSLTSSTNRFRHRINEAELVRMLREGESFDVESNATTRGIDMPKPVIQDPVLVRALDLLKGLAVLRQFRTL